MHRVKRLNTALLLGIVALSSAGCAERTPTSADPDLLPSGPTTVELRIPWQEFGSNLRVFGGFGSVHLIGSGLVARSYRDVLDARTLVRFSSLAKTATVTDSTGTSRTDTLLSIRGGRVVAFLDSASSVSGGPVTLELGALRQAWDVSTATWTAAADTGGKATLWEEPGAGPVARVTTAVWDPAKGDSVVFSLDSATTAMFRDTTALSRSVLLGMVTRGARLAVRGLALRSTVVPSVHRDTVIDVSSTQEALTFIYTPAPPAPGSGLRVGGAPAWRTTMDVAVPARIDGPPSLCAAAGCPLQLTHNRVNYAALVLSTRRTDAGFEPADSLGLEVRVVHDPSALPKSPLGSPLVGGFGKMLGPDLFWGAEGTAVEIPITGFVTAILKGDSVGGFPPPHSLALLSALEPSSLAFASFFGPGTPKAPVLRLIVTVGRSVELP